MARADWLGRQGVWPSRWLQLTMRVWGMVAPNGAGSQARGTGTLAQQVVAALGAPKGYGSP